MIEKPKSQILLFLTTNPNAVKNRILRFRNAFIQSGENCDFAIVSFYPDRETSIVAKKYNGVEIKHYVYGPDALKELGYPVKGNKKPFKLIPGNTDLVTLLFFRSHPHYEQFWLMEDDVEYTGDPCVLFTELMHDGGDLLATHVAKGYKSWTYSDLFRSPDSNIDIADTWLTFLPFFRINKKSLQLIDHSYMNGWNGHNEMTWPTILKINGHSVVDIGGSGKYVLEQYRNKHYIGSPGGDYEKRGSFGTMNIRLRPGKEKNVLWHPIKLTMPWLRQNRKRFISIIKWQLSKFTLNRS